MPAPYSTSSPFLRSLQLIPFNNASLVADRYVYLPIIGLAYFFSQLTDLVADRFKNNSIEPADLRNVFFAFTVLLLIVPSIQRVEVWKNSVSLFDDVIEKNDRIGIAYGNRADAELKEGNFSSALADCNELVRLKPDDGRAYYDRGNALLGLQRYRAAVIDLSRSIQLGDAKSSVYYNRGTAYYDLGAVDTALADFHAARVIDPSFADAAYSIGYAMCHSGRDARDAMAYFDSAIRNQPRYTEALYQRSNCRKRTQKVRECNARPGSGHKLSRSVEE